MQEKIHRYQLAIIIYMIQVGISIFTLPRIVAEAFGTNGWIALLFVSFIGVLNILLIGLVFHFGKDRTIFQLLEKSIPKLLLFPIYIAIALLWSCLAVLIAKDFELILRLLYYPTMPTSVFVIMALILTYWLVRSGIVHIARTTVIFMATIVIALILLFPLAEFRLTRLTSFIFEGETSLFTGGLQVYFSFLGYELSLLLIPYLTKKKSAYKPVLFGHLLITFIYLITCFIAFGFFSFPQLLNDTFPLLTMFEYIELPFLERIEGMIFHLFIFEVLVTIILYFWGADQFFKQAIPKLSSRFSILILLIIAFILTLFIKITREVEKWIMIIGSGGIIVAFGLPIFILLLMGISNIVHRLRT
ncbi:GerAB/ArcD/ProY family transporter [Bacillus spongiae]|uniref:GerAB/ArcD/ProY family transporter n=1 Tax=Bacillus spongiae TaxID=2683610 RepID=A0ABU8HE24_9BACI